jgi:hypothetical protein
MPEGMAAYYAFRASAESMEPVGFGAHTYQGITTKGIFSPLCEGEGTQVDEKGNTFRGIFKTGVPSGQGIQVNVDGSGYEGLFEMGFPSGQGILTFSDGAKYVGTFEKGFGHGRGRYISSEGVATECDLDHGIGAGSPVKIWFTPLWCSDDDLAGLQHIQDLFGAVVVPIASASVEGLCNSTLVD